VTPSTAIRIELMPLNQPNGLLRVVKVHSVHYNTVLILTYMAPLTKNTTSDIKRCKLKQTHYKVVFTVSITARVSYYNVLIIK